MLVSIHPYYVFYQGTVLQFSESDNLSYRSKLEQVFVEVSQFLKLDGSGILVTVTRDIDFNVISSFVRQNSIDKVYFFLDDVFQINFGLEKNSIDCSIIEQHPGEFSIVEFDLIEKFVTETGIYNEVYYCEHNLNQIKDMYPLLNFKFFDITNAITMNGVFSNTINFDYKETFKYKLCCFNYRPDVNRTIIVSLLYDQSDVFLTGGKLIDYRSIQTNRRIPLDKFSSSVRKKITNGLLDIEKNSIPLTWDFSVDHRSLPLKQHWNVVNIINDSFCNIVTETKYDTYTTNFSEKTIKPILVRRPFVLVAAPGTLQLLKNLGFKTFNRWWDESYDSIVNHNDRLEEIYKLIQCLLSKSTDELNNMLKEMQPILLHNFENAKMLNEKMLLINSY